tara:strand:- start:2620 stop:3519 length:900 start_codon:yes stop_codon:yes gene_type:complete
MKHLKIYITTYKRPEILEDTLEKLFSSDFEKVKNTEVNIINNHSEFSLSKRFEKRVNVLNNVLRPDWSNGNLSENWNQALINGFVNLNNPDAEYVVTMQNDTSVDPNWHSNLMKMHENYNFVVGKYGDNLVSYTPEAVKKIGIWDQNFPGLGYKEADYWIRALIHNKNKSCINDTLHGLELNNENALSIDTTEDRNFVEEYDKNLDKVVLKRKADSDSHQKVWHSSRGGIFKPVSWKYFNYKWSGTWRTDPQKVGWIKSWSKEFVESPPDIKKSRVKMFMRYVYFEKDIYDLPGKNYLI